MSDQTFHKKLREYPARLSLVEKKIVAVARGLVPVLRDAQREHSAKELDALFFELDALTQEMGQFVDANLPAFIDAIRREGGI